MVVQITELDPPRKLSITWGSTGGVTFELEPRGNNVLLTVIHHRVTDPTTRLNVSAGWHMHLDVLAARVRGEEPPPFWDGWLRLEAGLRDAIVGVTERCGAHGDSKGMTFAWSTHERCRPAQEPTRTRRNTCNRARRMT